MNEIRNMPMHLLGTTCNFSVQDSPLPSGLTFLRPFIACVAINESGAASSEVAHK